MIQLSKHARPLVFRSRGRLSGAGQPFSGAVADFTDTAADAGNYSASINWGDGNTTAGTVVSDGNGGWEVDGNYTYAAAGLFNASVTIWASDSRVATSACQADVSTITASGQTIAATQGQFFTDTVATFTDSSGNIDPTRYTAGIDWLGNGTSVPGTVVYDSATGSFTVTGTNNIASGGSLYPVVTITDESNGSFATADGEVDVAGMVVSEQDFNAVQGGNFSGVVGDLTDTAPDAGNFTSGNYSASIAWGDGNTSAGTLSDDGNGGFDISGNHTYAAAGVYDATVTVTASDSRSSVSSGTVANVTSLTATAATGISGAQGGNFSGSVATFTDLNSGTTASDYGAFIDWGDGNDSDGTITGNDTVGFTVSGSNTFAAAGSLTVTVYITDPSGATATATDTANVTGIIANPPESAIQTVAGEEVDNVTLATFVNTTSGNAAGNYTASIDWLGDGTDVGSGTVTTDGNGNYTVTGNITTGTFTSDGTFNPVVTITDTDDGTTALATAEVDVAEPTLSVSVISISPTPGTQFSGNVATFSDTDTSATAGNFTAEIDWGDGNVSDNATITPVTGSPGNFTISGSNTYLAGGSYTIQIMVVDDSGDNFASGNATATVTGLQTPTLTATPASDSEIDLTYSDTDGVHLELYEKGPTDSCLYEIADLGDGPVTDGTFAVTSGLAPTTTYSFSLRADSNGQVAYGNASATTLADPGGGGNSSLAQPAPTDVSVAQCGTYPEELGIEEYVATFDGPNGGWPTDFLDTNSGLDAFYPAFSVARTDDPYHVLPVSADNFGDGEWVLYNGQFGGQPGTFDFTDAPGVQLAFTVSHCDSQDGEAGLVDSPPSTPFIINVPGTPWTPLQLTATPADDDSGEVMLTWSGEHNGNDTVEIFLADAGPAGLGKAQPWGNYTAGDEQAEVPAGNAGQSFFAVELQTVDPATGWDLVLPEAGPYSNFVPADGATAAPNAPGNLSATPYINSSGCGINLLWDNSSGNVTNFTIERSTDSGFIGNVTTFSVGADQTSYTDTSAVPGVTYWYEVQVGGANTSTGGGMGDDAVTAGQVMAPGNDDAPAGQRNLAAGPVNGTVTMAAPYLVAYATGTEGGSIGVQLDWNGSCGPWVLQRSTSNSFDPDDTKEFDVSGNTYFDAFSAGGFSARNLVLGQTYYYRIASAATVNANNPVWSLVRQAAIVFTARNMHAIGVDTGPVTRDGSPGTRDAGLEIQAGMDLIRAVDQTANLLGNAVNLAAGAAQSTLAAVETASQILAKKLVSTAWKKITTPNAASLQQQAEQWGKTLYQYETKQVGVVVWVKVVGDIYVGNALVYSQVPEWLPGPQNGPFNPPSGAFNPAMITGPIIKEAIDHAESTFAAYVSTCVNNSGQP